MSNQNPYPDTPAIPDPTTPDGEEITGMPVFLFLSHRLGSHPAKVTGDAYDADNILKQPTTANKQMGM